MSFREKSAWIALLTTIAAFVPYFAYVLGLLRREELTLGPVLGAFIGAVVFQVILLTVLHIGLALHAKQESKDERDVVIESKSFRNAYFVLTSSCFVIIPCVLAFGIAFVPQAAPRILTSLFFSQLLLLCFVFAEATKYLTQAVSYRRGA